MPPQSRWQAAEPTPFRALTVEPDLVALRMSHSQAHRTSLGPKAAPSASSEASATPTESPSPSVGPLSSPTPFPEGMTDASGQQVVARPPPSGSQPAVSGDQAVQVAWDHYMWEAGQPKRVTASYASVESFPDWVVTFGGVCLNPGGPGTTGDSTPTPTSSDNPCPVTSITVLIDGTTGEWIQTFWG